MLLAGEAEVGAGVSDEPIGTVSADTPSAAEAIERLLRIEVLFRHVAEYAEFYVHKDGTGGFGFDWSSMSLTTAEVADILSLGIEPSQ